MWLAHEQYQLIWEDRQREMQREAAKIQLVKLALAARREQGQTAHGIQILSRIRQALGDRLGSQPQANPYCAPAE